MKQIFFAAEDPLFNKIEDIRFVHRQKSITATLKLLLNEGIKVVEQSPSVPVGRVAV